MIHNYQLTIQGKGSTGKRSTSYYGWGGVRGGVAGFLKAKFRNTDFVAKMISRFGVIYVSAQIQLLKSDDD